MSACPPKNTPVEQLVRGVRLQQLVLGPVENGRPAGHHGADGGDVLGALGSGCVWGGGMGEVIILSLLPYRCIDS